MAIYDNLWAPLTMDLEGKSMGTKECPLIYQWHERKYWGAAHGTTGTVFCHVRVSMDLLKKGILYILLSVYEEFIKPVEDWENDVRTTIHHLLGVFENGGYTKTLLLF